MNLSQGRLTSKKFIAWLNTEFERLGLTQYEVTKVVRTHYTSQQYESGAAKLIVTCSDKQNPNDDAFFLCFYFLSEMEEYLKMGNTLELRFENHLEFLTNLRIEVLSN